MFTSVYKISDINYPKGIDFIYFGKLPLSFIFSKNVGKNPIWKIKTIF